MFGGQPGWPRSNSSEFKSTKIQLTRLKQNERGVERERDLAQPHIRERFDPVDDLSREREVERVSWRRGERARRHERARAEEERVPVGLEVASDPHERQLEDAAL